MIASIYAATIVFVFGRLIHHLFLFEGQLLLVVTIILSLGIILSEAMAFQSKKLREILLYSSISQASIVLLLFVNNILLYAVYLIVANAIAKFILFMITTMISQPEHDDLPSVSGVFKKQVLIGIAFTIAVLSMIGLPLFVGFQIKLNFLIELALKDAFLVIFIILAAAVVEGIYYIAVLVKLWFGEETIERPILSVSLRVLFLVMSLSFLVLG